MDGATTEQIAVVGLGYVGLPLALLFLKKGFDVIGMDVDAKKVEYLHRGESYLNDVSNADVTDALRTGRWQVTSSFDQVSAADAIILCVPTPLNARREPDLTYVRSAAKTIEPYLHEGQMVVLESTTFPGTTEEILTPLLSSRGLVVGRDLFVAYSPERIDPGSRMALDQIPKVVSGMTEACKSRIADLYGRVFQTIVPVSNTRTAEMVKILENCQRLINISFMNELSVVCRSQQIDVWEAIRAASTKPYGFTPYFPGPGIGGHCIPVDPLYLKWKANQLGIETRMIDSAHEVNLAMPGQVLQLVRDAIAVDVLTGKHILVLGVAYKKDVNDVRESPALLILDRLIDDGAIVSYYDPYVSQVILKSGASLHNAVGSRDDLVAQVKQSDCVVILTDHSIVDYQTVVREAKLVVDTRNATKDLCHAGHVVSL